jgi:hypothetical protein
MSQNNSKSNLLFVTQLKLWKKAYSPTHALNTQKNTCACRLTKWPHPQTLPLVFINNNSSHVHQYNREYMW